MVKDLPANTGDVGSIPGTWRTPYTVGQPSPGATTPEPAHHRACALQQEKPRDEKALHNQESSPYSLQLEKACVAKRLSTAKKTPKTPNKYMHNIPTHAFRLHTTHLTCSVVGQPVFAPWGPLSLLLPPAGLLPLKHLCWPVPLSPRLGAPWLPRLRTGGRAEGSRRGRSELQAQPPHLHGLSALSWGA